MEEMRENHELAIREVPTTQSATPLLLMTILLSIAGTVLPICLLEPARYNGSRLLIQAVAGLIFLLAGRHINVSEICRRGTAAYFYVVDIVFLLLLLSVRNDSTIRYIHFIVMLYPAAYSLLLGQLKGRGRKGLLLAFLGLWVMVLTALASPHLKDAFLVLISGTVLVMMAAKRDWFGIGDRSGFVSAFYGVMASYGALIGVAGVRLYCRLYLYNHVGSNMSWLSYNTKAVHSVLGGARPLGTGELVGRWAGCSIWDVVPANGTDAFLVTAIHFLGWLPVLMLCLCLCVVLAWFWKMVKRQTWGVNRFLAVGILLPMSIRVLICLRLTCGFGVMGVSCPLLRMSMETVVDMALIGVVLASMRVKNRGMELIDNAN